MRLGESHGSAVSILVFVVVLICAVAIGWHFVAHKSAAGWEGTWKDTAHLPGKPPYQMIISKSSSGTYAVQTEGISGWLPLVGTPRGDTLNLTTASLAKFPVYLKLSGNEIDVCAVSDGHVTVRYTR